MAKRKSKSIKKKVERENVYPVYPFHPACLAVAEMEKDDRARLAADLKANGLLEPIQTYEEGGETYILDGRNRYEVGMKLDIPLTFEALKNVDPWSYVLSKNVARRHLTKSQIGLFLGERQKRDVGVHGTSVLGKDVVTDLPKTAEELAEEGGVSVTTVERGRKVADKGTPELKEAVKSGDLPLKEAAAVAGKSKKEQHAAVVEAKAPKVKKEKVKPEPLREVTAKTYDLIYLNMTDKRFIKTYPDKGSLWERVAPAKKGFIFLRLPSDHSADLFSFPDIASGEKDTYHVSTLLVSREKGGANGDDNFAKATHDVIYVFSPEEAMGHSPKFKQVMDQKEWLLTMKEKLPGTRKLELLGHNVDGWDQDLS
jgi:hypothetical protein